ncbi:MAG: InlB B-repeat-containing protein [Erysipelotrichaceae bacterium]|nr:InlB B-repeat-containing protein [Erysipelotrichaceae bacterium]
MLFSSTGNGLQNIYAETDENNEEPAAAEVVEAEPEAEVAEETEEVPVLTETEETLEETLPVIETEEPEEEEPEVTETAEEEPAQIMAEGYTATVTYQLSDGEYMIVNGEKVTSSYTETVDYYGENGQYYFHLTDNVPEKERSLFLGWKVTVNGYVQDGDYYTSGYDLNPEDAEGSYITETNVEVVCTPIWTRVLTFTIAYHLNMEGATLFDSAESVVTRTYENIAERRFSFPWPSKEGMSYIGWSFTADAEDKITVAELFDKAETSSTIDLYARWKEATLYYVIYRVDPSEGYIYLDENGQPVYEFTDTFEFEDDGRMVRPTSTFLYPVSTVEGKVFNGWVGKALDFSGNNIVDQTLYPGDALNLGGHEALVFDEENKDVFTASWTVGETYTMRLHLNGGTLSNRSEYVQDFVMDGDTAVASFTEYDVERGMTLPNSEHTWYLETWWKIINSNRQFMGWSTSPEPAQDETLYKDLGSVFRNAEGYQIPVSDIELYAVWAPEPEQQYTATLHLNGGTLINCDEYTKISDDVYQFTFTEEDVTNQKSLPAGSYYEGKPGIEKKWYRYGGWKTEDGEQYFRFSLDEGFEGRKISDIELYVSWIEVRGAIYYYTNAEDALMIGESVTDGTLPVRNVYNYPEEVHITQMAIRENYVLSGWASGEEHAEAGIVDYYVGDKAAFEEIFASDTIVQLYAVWREKPAETYTVSFYVNGGEIEGHPANKTGVAAFEIAADELGGIQPTKAGYLFAGWFSDSKLTKEISPETFASDPKKMNLYAKWVAKDYYVTLHANANDAYILVKDVSSGVQIPSPTDSVSATYGKEIALTAKAIRPGYTFKGWAETADGEVKYKSGTKYKSFAEDPELYGTVDLYAVWAINTYTLKLNVNGGTVDEQTVKKNVVTIKFNAENAWDIQNKYVYSDETIHRNGYIFKGWYTDKKFKNPVWTPDDAVPPVRALNNLTLYAKWEAKDYYVTMHANADDAYILVKDVSSGEQRPSPSDFVSATYGKAMALTAKVIRPGYTFKGWAETADGAVKYKSGTKYKNFAEDPELYGTVDLYAVWAINTYTLKLNVSGGTVDEQTVKKNVATIKFNAENAEEIQNKYVYSAEAVYRNGYIFKGWYKDKKFKNPVWTPEGGEATEKVLKNLTLYAKWEAKDYYVTMHANADDAYILVKDVSSGEQRPSPSDFVSATYGKAMALTAKVIRPGYTFKGWAETADGAVKYKSGTKYKNFAEDPEQYGTVDLYAVWSANTYTISIKVNGGTVQDLKVSSGTAKTTYTVEDTSAFRYLSEPGLYSRAGYVFDGLYTDKALTKPFDQTTLLNPPANITVYIKWIKE